MPCPLQCIAMRGINDMQTLGSAAAVPCASRLQEPAAQPVGSRCLHQRHYDTMRTHTPTCQLELAIASPAAWAGELWYHCSQ